MAYRRKQGYGKDLISNEIINPNPNNSLATEETESLAAQAIRASSAHRDSSLSSAYGQSAVSPRPANVVRSSFSTSVKVLNLNLFFNSMF